MSDITIKVCNKCEEFIKKEDPHWIAKVLIEIQDKVVAEQTLKDREVWAKVDLCARCTIDILHKIIRSKFTVDLDLAKYLRSHGVLFDFTER